MILSLDENVDISSYYGKTMPITRNTGEIFKLKLITNDDIQTEDNKEEKAPSDSNE